MKRLFHLVGVVWFFTALLAGRLGRGRVPAVLVGMVVLSGIILYRFHKGKLPLWVTATAAAFSLCMGCCVLYNGLHLAPAQAWEGDQAVVSAAVVAREAHTGYTRWTLLAVNGRTPEPLVGRQIQAVGFTALDVEPGDVVECTVEFDSSEEERTARYASGICLSGTLRSGMHIVGYHGGSLRVQAARYRERAAAHLVRLLPNGEGAVLSGMLFGMDEAIPGRLRTQYSRAGIAHLLAVSGLHLSIFQALAGLMLRGLVRYRRKRCLLRMALTLGFLALTGFTPSVSRAGVMFLLVELADLLGRESDPLNSLGFAVVLLLLGNPYAAYSFSLQLSYLATMGICLFSKPFSQWLVRTLRCRKGAALELISATFCAGLLTRPLLCHRFGVLSLVSPAVNLLVLPVFPFLLASGLLCSLSALFPFASLPGRAAGLAAGVLVRWINQFAGWWSSLPFAALPVREGYQILWLGAATFVFLLLRRMRARAPHVRYAAALFALCLMVGGVSHQAVAGNQIRVAVAEHGDTVALAYGGQGAVLGAPASQTDAQELAAFLRACGVRRIVLLAVERESAFSQEPVRALAREIPVETAVSLEGSYGFTAELFGCVWIYADRWDDSCLTADIGGLRLVKLFSEQPAAAHLLVDARNEIVFAPGYQTRLDGRFFNSKVFGLRLPSDLKQAVEG